MLWYRACFSLFISPSLLHLCVICRKFHLHANLSEFGHVLPEFLPFSSSPPGEQQTCTHSNTKQMRNITEILNPHHLLHISSYQSLDKHRHISIHAACKKCSHTKCNLPEYVRMETPPMTQGLWFWPCGGYMLMVQSVHHSFLVE